MLSQGLCLLLNTKNILHLNSFYTVRSILVLVKISHYLDKYFIIEFKLTLIKLRQLVIHHSYINIFINKSSNCIILFKIVAIHVFISSNNIIVYKLWLYWSIGNCFP